MRLTEILTDRNVDILTELLREFYDSDENKFEYSFDEKHVCLNIELIKLKENTLILTFFPKNDMYASGQYLIELEEGLKSIFENNDYRLTQFHLDFHSFGNHSPKQSLFVRSNLSILSLNVNNCKFVDFSISGSFESINFHENNSTRVNINECITKNLIIKNFNSLNSTNTYSGHFNLLKSRISNLTVIGSNRYKNIRIQNSKLLNSEIRGCNSSLVVYESIESNNVNFSQNVFDSLLIENIKPQPRCLITIKKNSFKGLFLNHIGTVERRFLIGLTYLKPKLQILFEGNEIEKIEAKKMVWYYNTIIAPPSNKEEKKDIILLIKSYYNQKQDTLDEKLFKSFEKIWRFKSYNKWSIPLIFSYYSNRFGLSLLRPFILIVLLIFMEFLIFYFAMGDNCKIEFLKGVGDLSYLINPAHKTTIFTDYLNFCTRDSFAYNVITITDNLGRILMGYLIFQFIDAFRYKYNLGR